MARKITATITIDTTFTANKHEEKFLARIEQASETCDDAVYDLMKDRLEELIRKRLEKIYGTDVTVLDLNWD